MLNNKTQKIGAFFTPIFWGKFFVEEFKIFEKWLGGASIFDPTMGNGNLIFSLLEYALEKNYSLKKLPLNNLYGAEMNEEFFQKFFSLAKKKYGIVFSKNNFYNQDIFFLKKNQKFDILFGNPPWQNFTDLPENYKEKIKPLFQNYNLIKENQKLLLGYSRIDIAALVIQKTIYKNLKKNGEAIFFTPLSLFLNEGAHSVFRSYKVKKTNYSLQKIFDFNKEKVFSNVSTRYGLAYFIKNKKQTYPIDYFQFSQKKWQKLFAEPIFSAVSPLSISDKKKSQFKNFVKIPIPKNSQPRQGINCCGASNLFFFDSCEKEKNNTLLLKNKTTQALLPEKYIYPLVTSDNFLGRNLKAKKWVLLPYHKNGKILKEEEIKKEALLWEYLLKNKSVLENRKGIFLGGFLKRKQWWALLGVGAYNFANQKIIWESYGRKKFSPKIFSGRWQANQSLQAFIPIYFKEESKKILQKLQNPEIESYLLSQQMQGTMNWAQVGRIKPIFSFIE